MVREESLKLDSHFPKLDKRIRPHLNQTNDSWRVDETYIKAECRRGNLPSPFLLVKGQWKYLDRAVDSDGNTRLLTAQVRSRDALFSRAVFAKMLKASHTQVPRVINVDKNAAYPPAIAQLTADEQLAATTELRQVKYLGASQFF